MNKAKPVIDGLNKPIEVGLGKRLEWIDDNIIITCPECGNTREYLDDTADLEYGSFYISDECYNCGKEYENIKFNVKAYVVIEEEV